MRALLIGLFLVNGGWIFAQGTIRGFVTDKSNGEPAIFVTVSLEGTSYGVTTDVTGYYALSKIPAGTYTINVSSVEYETVTQKLTIEGSKVVTVNFQVSPKVTELQGVEISAEQAERKTEVKMSVETLRPVDIKRIPSFGGQQDIVQALQVLPGFVSTGDQGGQLYIRGGSPVQNKVLLDGMIIYNAFHSIGLFSVFDTDIIANADVYTGGFTGEFGGRISSVMDITTRDGNKKEFRGKFGASPFGAKLLLEGPLKKLGENGGGISYVVSAKRSYLEQSSQLFYNYIDDAGLPFNAIHMPFNWIDIGRLSDYWEANQRLMRGQFNLVRMPGTEVQPGVWCGLNVKVDWANARIEGPVYIGAGSEIHGGAEVLGPTWIGHGCVVEGGARIRRSILFEYSRLGSRADVNEAVVFGRNCVDKEGNPIHAGDTQLDWVSDSRDAR